ncbi:MAG: hypothetical protein ACPG4Y_03150 [Chitinophagales bacterium]
MKYFFVLFFLFSLNLFGQKNQINKRSTYHVNSLATHPFGVFFSRTNHNFKIKASTKTSFNSHISSGNIWLQKVSAFFPTNKADQDYISTIPWNDRIHFFDTETQEHQSTQFEADGVIRQYITSCNIPFLKNHEIQLNTRMFSLDEGKAPFSILTNDNVIESFHSNIAGGEDPFGRRNYEFNQAKIRYTDINDNKIILNNRDFVFSGIDLSYYYYPNIKLFEKFGLFTNFGLQTGINFSETNKSLDLGLNAGLTKIFAFKKNNELRLAVSLGLMHPSLAKFSKSNVHLIQNRFLFSTEFNLEYVKHLKKSNYISLSFGYALQSPFNKKKDFEQIVLDGDRRSTHWHYTFSHLYRFTSANTLTFTYGTDYYAFWFYLRQDFLVDNAPDIQTGLGLKIYIQ